MIEPITGYAVYCDRCGAEMEYDSYLPVFDSEQEARDAARDAGWQEYEYGRFACENCKETLNEKD